MKVLGIETSCDETAVAIYDGQAGLVSHQLYSQVALHAQYGGVVPELASRDHIKKISSLTRAAIADANLTFQDISAIAYTAGPGLVGSLMVGACFAKSLGWSLRIPTLGIHHMEAHLLAAMLEDQVPDYPFIALLVSGGHTVLVDVRGLGDYQMLGETLDDAVGEVFDKAAKLMGLPYPGGAALSKMALQGQPHFKMPRPMLDRPGLDFSYSGLKTHVANLIRQSEPSHYPDIAYGFQEAVVDTLVVKAQRALALTGYTRLVVAGGVGANEALRSRLRAQTAEVFFPKPEYCTDNGAMVAYLGYQRLSRGERDATLAVEVKARWPLNILRPPESVKLPF